MAFILAAGAGGGSTTIENIGAVSSGAYQTSANYSKTCSVSKANINAGKYLVTVSGTANCGGGWSGYTYVTTYMQGQSSLTANLNSTVTLVNENQNTQSQGWVSFKTYYVDVPMDGTTFTASFHGGNSSYATGVCVSMSIVKLG